MKADQPLAISKILLRKAQRERTDLEHHINKREFDAATIEALEQALMLHRTRPYGNAT
jgi:hypothetical protein